MCQWPKQQVSLINIYLQITVLPSTQRTTDGHAVNVILATFNAGCRDFESIEAVDVLLWHYHHHLSCRLHLATMSTLDDDDEKCSFESDDEDVVNVLPPTSQATSKAAFKCTKCDLVFEKQHQRNRHVATKHTTKMNLQLDDGSIFIVSRDETTGHFHCPESSCHHKTGFQRSDKLVEHYRSQHSKKPWPPSDNRTKKRAAQDDTMLHQSVENKIILPVPDSDTPSAILPSCLRRVCLHHPINNQQVIFLICTESNYILPPTNTSHILTHVHNHKFTIQNTKRLRHDNSDDLAFPSDQSIVDFVTNGRFTLHDSVLIRPWLSPDPSFSVTPLPGIPIMKGHQCTKCGKCLVATKSVRNHRSEFGSDHTFRDAAVQVLLPSAGRQYIPVNYNLQPSSTAQTVIACLKDDIAQLKLLSSSDVPTEKARNPWLRLSKWPELAKSFVPSNTAYDTITACIKKDSQDEDALKFVHDNILSYMSKFKEAAICIDYQFLRLVMGRDEHGQVPSRGLRPHSVPSTSTKYCNYLSGFVCGLLRSLDAREQNQPKLLGELNEDQITSGTELLASRASASTSLLPLHNFLLSLWTPAATEYIKVQARSDSNVLRYLLLSSLQSSSGNEFAFQHVSTVTGRCSILFYWIRSTILMELGRSLWLDPSDSITPLTTE
jgi:hypothetical protein